VFVCKMSRIGPPEVTLVKMDPKGVSKITALEVWNNGSNFETIKGNVKVKSGKWYYEVKLLTYGKTHIGYVNDGCTIVTNTYTGIGHDSNSYSYDGSCQRAYFGNATGVVYGSYWNQNDIIGVVFDAEHKTISYYRNGEDMGIAFKNVAVGDGLTPAISLQRQQKVLFNFGKTPFKYPICEIFPDIYPLHLTLTREQTVQLEKLFEKYKAVGISLSESGETDDIIKGTGTLDYAKDLGIVEDTDPMLMVVAWKLNVNHEKAWEFNRREWMDGWSIHGCAAIDTMKKKSYRLEK